MSETNAQSKPHRYTAAEFGDWMAGRMDRAPEYIKQWATMVDSKEDLDLLLYLDSIWQHNDVDKPFRETDLCEEIVTSSNTRGGYESVKHGNISMMKARVGLTDNTQDAGDVVPIIVDYLSNEGSIAVLCGPPGSGKTALMLDVMRSWMIKTGGHVYTNVGWDGADEVVETDTALLEAMATVRGQTLGAIDETNRGGLTGEGTDVKTANKFADAMTMVRKKEADHGPYAKQGSVLAVSHNWDKMAKPMREMATFVIEKPSQKDKGRVRLFESPGGQDSRQELGNGFKGLTDTRETYREHESSSFSVMMDDDDGEEPSADDARDDALTEAAIRAHKPWSDADGQSYREIADTSDAGEPANGIVPRRKSWVGETVREWKDGQHRDLVADPRTDDGGENA
jgi:hypothetical protein